MNTEMVAARVRKALSRELGLSPEMITNEMKMVSGDKARLDLDLPEFYELLAQIEDEFADLGIVISDDALPVGKQPTELTVGEIIAVVDSLLARVAA